MSDPAPAGRVDRVALCVARFYAELADQLEAGARAALEQAGVVELDRFDVPGAFELPLAAAYAARSGRYDAIVCLGAVIRGETDHYDYVCTEAARGIQQVQLETGVPCGFGVSARAGSRPRRRSSALAFPALSRVVAVAADHSSYRVLAASSLAFSAAIW